ncbi:peptidoglycan DD-metalloendopeptidase family protein [Pistricoccus aurantiacus]|uniref:Peptidoglycan DD-metalloendopeptidase family protein n=1 Tax=Pistricoccus aurantiacus TaxID=1883414 RepID=A0A5B8SQB1_9GAMM|nr:peptidoglycan DD-metalloendopeptidase family protein [Pistricoccus aurantiacus]QEA38394.1 peptidoglycan DD-metalloendopeptidase family protein [Pistricoccus aurantiacus]
MRRPRIAAWLMSVLTAVIITAVPASTVLAAPDEREAKARLDAIGSDIQAMNLRLSKTREAQDNAARALRKVETALAETNRRLDTLQAERRGLVDELEALEEKRETLRKSRREQLEALASELDALYRMGDSPQLKLLLNQDDPARLDRLQTYLNHLSKARTARLDEIQRLDAQLGENRRQLDRQQAALAEVVATLESQSLELAEQRRQRQQLLAKLDSRYQDERSRLAALDQDRQQAEKMLSQVQEELARLKRPPPSTAIAKTQGKLPWPVQGKIESRFGSGRGVNRNGLLIAAPEGSPVQAIHAGRVVFADWMRGFGNLLIVDHGDQVMTLYAHLQHFQVQVGSPVKEGEVVAAVGQSGGRSSPALYFEVRRQGEPIDPQRWIARR